MEQIRSRSQSIALGCGVLGVLAAVWAYWLILPGLILGAVAVVLGWRARRARRDGGSERGSVAMALGIVAILLVPSVLVAVDGAEKWGRDCALAPTHDSNC
jgi:hypothetical protein